MSDSLIYAWIALAIVLIPVQLLVPAPYGRHVRSGWGPVIPARIGWVLMEAVALVAFTWFFLAAGKWTEVTILIATLFAAHYVHRSAIYPLLMRESRRRIPLLIVLFAVIFNSVNGYLNGEYLGFHGAQYPLSYLQDIRCIVGAVLFVAGAAINVVADYRLISLRKTGADTGYQIPQGGLFRFISCPNHFGEIIEWTGFAVMCWNLPALAFAVWTASNLIPRAIHHHRWYRRQFPDYPAGRRAVIPFIL
ncbi:MAG: DUF1295 domain-containing protein [Saprospiraceae bacterium]|nr:DUF1295 domain-containing protein [Saprospiraceae bacterium]